MGRAILFLYHVSGCPGRSSAASVPPQATLGADPVPPECASDILCPMVPLSPWAFLGPPGPPPGCLLSAGLCGA